METFFLGVIMGGFRRGEFIALDEDDCDFENSRLRIDESISSTKNGQADISDTKNEPSNDYVDSHGTWRNWPSMLKACVLRFEAKANGTWKGGDRNFIFHSGTGKPYYHTTPSQQWKNWCERHDFRNVSLHGLRHTNAMYLLGQGAFIKEIHIDCDIPHLR